MPRLICVVLHDREHQILPELALEPGALSSFGFSRQEESLVCELPSEAVHRAHVPIDSLLAKKTKERLTPMMVEILDGVHVRRMSLERITKEIRAKSVEKPVFSDVKLSFQVATGILGEMLYADC